MRIPFPPCVAIASGCLSLRAAIVGCILVAVPVAASIYMARLQSIHEQERQAGAMASEVLRRSHSISAQIDEATEIMEAGQPSDPCSPDNIRKMVQATAERRYLAAVGYIRDNRLMCSSFGTHGTGIPIGAPDFLSRLGFYVWPATGLAGITDEKFLVSMRSRSGYAGIVHAGGAIDLQSDNQGISLGLYGLARLTPLLQRGRFQPEWPLQLGQQDQAQFFDGQYIVAIERSRRFEYAAYAAIPVTRLQESWMGVALLLVPMGIVAGFLLALLVLRVSQHNKALSTQLKLGLKRDELFLLYQPIVELASGRWIGAEALLRWRRPGGQLVPPDVFIPVAEKSQLIGKVTARVLELFAADTGALLRARPDFYIGLNLSAGDFQDPGIAQKLKHIADSLGIQPGNIHVEVTERLLMNTDASLRNMELLRSMGIRIAIDDFGTGYSSLSYLTSLPLDYLKIDKTFVDTIGKNAVTSEVVPHIIGIAQSLGLSTIAEGVEAQDQADYLRAHGVEYAQGWLYARPMPMQQLQAALLEQQSLSAREPGGAA